MDKASSKKYTGYIFEDNDTETSSAYFLRIVERIILPENGGIISFNELITTLRKNAKRNFRHDFLLTAIVTPSSDVFLIKDCGNIYLANGAYIHDQYYSGRDEYVNWREKGILTLLKKLCKKKKKKKEEDWLYLDELLQELQESGYDFFWREAVVAINGPQSRFMTDSTGNRLKVRYVGYR